VTIPNVLEKPTGALVNISFEGDMLQAKTVTLSRLEVSAPPLRLPVKGKIQLGEKFLLDAALATGTVSLSTVPEWIAKGGFEAGNLELSLDIKGRDRDWRTWKTTGWLALSNGLMMVKGTDGPIQDLYVRLLLARDTAELKRLSFRLLDSDLTIEGTMRNWTTKPAITAKLESNHMDIDLLIPKGQRAPIRDLLEN
jgi:hypothetical protein